MHCDIGAGRCGSVDCCIIGGRGRGGRRLCRTARNSSSAHPGNQVVRLDYEAYVPMAEEQMRIIAGEAAGEFGLLNVRVHHRVGTLAIGEAAVVVVVASAHRAAAFDGCRYVIEELKKRVPIWKKEVFNDGSEWVNARP